MNTIRHFTATGYLVHQNYVYLHWHKKVNMWLPPGGRRERLRRRGWFGEIKKSKHFFHNGIQTKPQAGYE